MSGFWQPAIGRNLTRLVICQALIALIIGCGRYDHVTVMADLILVEVKRQDVFDRPADFSTEQHQRFVKILGYHNQVESLMNVS